MCRVVGCGQGKPKYAGNRGVQAKMTLNYPGGQVNYRFFAGGSNNLTVF